MFRTVLHVMLFLAVAHLCVLVTGAVYANCDACTGCLNVVLPPNCGSGSCGSSSGNCTAGACTCGTQLPGSSSTHCDCD